MDTDEIVQPLKLDKRIYKEFLEDITIPDTFRSWQQMRSYNKAMQLKYKPMLNQHISGETEV